MFLDLSGLDEEVKSYKPTELETIYYLFWEKGISLEEFERLPIPYILGVIKTFSYIKNLEQKEIKKARRR